MDINYIEPPKSFMYEYVYFTVSLQMMKSFGLKYNEVHSAIGSIGLM